MFCSVHRFVLAACLIASVLCFSACEKNRPAPGEVIVTEQRFSLRHDGKNSWSLDVEGIIKNVGAVDVKKVVVTGYCRSCGEVVHQGHWFVNDLEKTPIQKDTISYLAAGDNEAFSFKEVAYYWAKGGEKPENIPEDIEVVIESFEAAN